MIFRSCRALAAAASLCALVGSAAAASPTPTFYEPTPYRSDNDSPFKGLSFSYFYLDDFESATRPPGYASVQGGTILGPGGATDSVDADAGTIDGSGTAGHSWFSTYQDGELTRGTSLFVFRFSSFLLGGLPTHVGIVWTDVGDTFSGTLGVGNVTFSAYDTGGNLIGTMTANGLGDGSVNGGTAEDRFFGLSYAAGIEEIHIAMNSFDWEVDHLQYGALNPVPEPEQWLLMALGIAAVVGMVRRRSA